MNASLQRKLVRHQRRILRRLENKPGVERPEPMMTAADLRYEIADRVRSIAPGGSGLSAPQGFEDDDAPRRPPAPVSSR